MRTRAVVTSVLASVGVLIIGWQAGSVATGGVSTGSTSSVGSTSSASSTGAADGTYTGDDVNTRFGSVQVQVTITSGHITDVTALQLTDNDRRSVQISNRAAPILAAEVISSQSAKVHNASGATYTSNAYLQSVQSVLDAAGF